MNRFKDVFSLDLVVLLLFVTVTASFGLPCRAQSPLSAIKKVCLNSKSKLQFCKRAQAVRSHMEKKTIRFLKESGLKNSNTEAVAILADSLMTQKIQFSHSVWRARATIEITPDELHANIDWSF